jgi:hypothetical protein
MLKSKAIFLLIIITWNTPLLAQEATYSTHSITVGAGIAGHELNNISGNGLVYSLGYQKKLLKSQRLAINPVLTSGNLLSILNLDASEQYYRLTSAQFRTCFDLVRDRNFSIFVGTGPYVTYIRGLEGTGGYGAGLMTSEYFHNVRIGGLVSAGFKVDNPNKRIGYELSPINLQMTNYYYFYHWSFILSIKFDKSNN